MASMSSLNQEVEAANVAATATAAAAALGTSIYYVSTFKGEGGEGQSV